MSTGAHEQKGRHLTVCHMCASGPLRPILDLGEQPHSDSFLREEQLTDEELRFPLRLVQCEDCGLLQIDYLVNPKILYQEEYLYQSSTTATGRAHYAELARTVTDRFSLPAASLVVDIGSNVGVLLQGFKACGMSVLGVDPARIPAQRAKESGIETIVDFFSLSIAKEIVRTHGHAHVIAGTNVFAHLHDLPGAVVGMRTLLAPQGVIVIEAPSALRLIEHVEYDTIYHQHVGYLSVKPMQRFFKQHDLELFAVEEASIHGGSLRYFVGHPGAHSVEDSVAQSVVEEESFGLYRTDRLAQFRDAVELQRTALIELLRSIKDEGKRVVAVSTPAKGNTLLNYCKLDQSLIAFATERNELKIGRYTPGTHIPIYSDDALMQSDADYALILAWNFADEIMANMREFKARGGKFIIPIPYPRIE